MWCATPVSVFPSVAKIGFVDCVPFSTAKHASVSTAFTNFANAFCILVVLAIYIIREFFIRLYIACFFRG